MNAWISCPAGYQPYVGSQQDLTNAKFPGTDRLMTESEIQGFACMNQYGTYLNQATPASVARQAGFSLEHNIGTLAFVGAGAALLFLPDGWKLLALPLALFGVSKKMAGQGF